MTRVSLSLLIFFAVSVSACGHGGDEAVIRQAESRLALPKRADPLLSYDRYYAISGRSATGIFIRSETGKGTIAIVATEKDLPFVADGSCGVIHVRLNLDDRKWERPACNMI
jgi:hypothetical protein